MAQTKNSFRIYYLATHIHPLVFHHVIPYGPLGQIQKGHGHE